MLGGLRRDDLIARLRNSDPLGARGNCETRIHLVVTPCGDDLFECRVVNAQTLGENERRDYGGLCLATNLYMRKIYLGIDTQTRIPRRAPGNGDIETGAFSLRLNMGGQNSAIWSRPPPSAFCAIGTQQRGPNDGGQ